MRIWLALLAAPVLALTDQTVSFALAGWSCANHWTFAPHAVHAVSLVAAIAATVIALQLWRATVPAKHAVDEALTRRHFLAGVASAVGAISAAAVAAMWIPNWMLSPCFA
jgi:hypothetical protein